MKRSMVLHAQGSTNPSTSRFRVLGSRVDAVTPGGVVGWMQQAIAQKRKTYIVFSTVSSVLCAREDTDVQQAFEAADLITPDGMPLVWLGRRRAKHPVERVYGPDLMLRVMEETGGTLRHFFYGGAPGVADQMAMQLRKTFPSLDIAGTHSPQVDSGKDLLSRDVELINSARPDVVWVGLGHPKQELWMHTHRAAIDAPILAGVGAAFDFLSGQKKEAPEWMKESGLQWAHRFASEPRRLWRRYLVGNFKFVFLLAREAIQSREAS